ncbi:MAG: SGNH/GDSL hydrolase family protein [Ornithinimicrobium sp.]|uniref:SGNH/GDSL hydrolase family protein n=1 Tax=Ornithinimicrobium sp. TaxID=1977084 RepID=UPI0026DF904A|nr:SGNH/GDSL hydrolase family protein [Ornithinimicrobium sp.]MDO5739393.1 SGNH/GDSL hydrolase family protein [Ornithinimicrobium sp.]
MRALLLRLRSWMGALGERGAGAIEYAGGTLLVGILISTAAFGVAATAPQLLGERLSGTICRAFAVLPGVDPACADFGDIAGALPQEEGTAVPEEVPYEDTLWTYDQLTSGPMVFVGDSYGSGEGAGDYDPDTDRGPSWWDNLWGNDVPENRCHRSGNAWGIQVGEQHWPGNYTFNACSGSVTADVENSNQDGNDGEGPQGEDITADTAMIFVSMGGNDAGFAPILKECLAAALTNGQIRGQSGGMAPESAMIYCSTWLDQPDPDANDGRSRRQVILDRVEARIRTMYAYLREQSKDGAHIVQMGYPALFDPGYIGLIESKDVAYLNTLSADLNAMIARVAKEQGIHFIDPTEAFADHGVGSDDPWLLGLGLGGNRALPPEAFHPNAAGQDAMQELIEEYLASLK